MPYLTSLADIARSAGLTVEEVQGWKARGRGSFAGVRTVVCHHTAGARTGDAPSLNVVTYGRADLTGPLSNFVLGRSGKVYVVAAGVCNHTGSVLQSDYGNPYAIGIEAENTGTGEPWPEVQLQAYAKLCASLAKAFGLPPSRVLGHKEICAPVGRKIDPTIDMRVFRLSVAEYMAGPPVAPTVPEGDTELVERIHIEPPNNSENIVRVYLSGTANAGIVIRTKLDGNGKSVPMWVGKIFAWGSDKVGVGSNPAAVTGYNPRIESHRRFELPGAVWADVYYSAAVADEFDIDCY